MRIRAKIKGLGNGWLVSLLSVASLAAAGSDLQLVEAVKQGNQEAVQALLNAHADVNAPQADGATALHWAVHRNDPETADLVIRAGANANAANDYGVTPLALACANGNGAMAEKLLQAGADANAALPAGETPLLLAARAGSAEAVKSLLARGADVNAKETSRGQTALMWAVAERHPEVARALIEKGADVRARSRIVALDAPIRAPTYFPDVHFPKSAGGFTPLLFAAQQGDLESARLLLAAGADVNDATPEDGSALVVATASGHEDFARFLLDKGADPNATDGYGITALHYAAQQGIQAISGAGTFATDRFGWFHRNMPELVKALLTHGANPNARIAKDFSPYDYPPVARAIGNNLPQMSLAGATPFLLAAASGDVTLMRVLVEGRANPLLTTTEGTTPLMVASGVAIERGDRTEEGQKNALEAAKLAVLLGADVNAAGAGGRTALHGAAFLGDTAMIQFLVEKGANLEAKDKYGQTPLSIALGDPEGLVYRQLPGAAYDYTFRQPRVQEKIAELLVKLGAAPFTGQRRDRSGE